MSIASRIPLAMALIATASLAACVPPAPQPTPAPSPAPTPPPPPPAPPPAPVAQLPAPTFENWLDAPQTPGDWSYAPFAGTSMTQASFGTGPGAARLTLSCDLATRQVRLAQPAAGATGPVQVRIRTETADRLTQARVEGASLVADFPASDSLLDAMAFSRGRIAIETAGREALYVPTYPEITRVVEDCRRGRL